MTTRKLATRKRMSKCFREAADYLWTGEQPYDNAPGYRYICFTFDCVDASVATRSACERLINERLGSCASVEEWLKVKGCIPRKSDNLSPLWPRIQAFRRAWLLHLAEEFSQP